VFAELRSVDAVLSPYRDGSDLSAWERGALRLADVDPMLATVVALGDEARQRTGGWFDPRGLPDPRTGEPRYDPSGLDKGWAGRRTPGRRGRHLRQRPSRRPLRRPHTGRPATAARAVTVTGPTLLGADVYATAAVARGPSALPWLESLDGYDALLVTRSRLLRITAGWPAP
jgi:thiamine biosynthesis lipoprotein